MESCRRILETGLDTLQISWSEAQIDRLLAFLKLIEKWNKAYNLTAIRNLEDMARLHLLDSLAVLPYIKGKQVIDIGTGAGLPGIPLAIFLPETSFILLDSNAKKTRFVQQAVLELKLGNVEVCHSRAEAFQPEQKFDTVITRAFASLPAILETTEHLLNECGVLLAMKGQNPQDELAAVKVKSSVVPLATPGVEAERCLVIIQKEAIPVG
ncbi:16S rRNA (guanine(527)-N(7))-methyltransferase RsmG [Candidatus Methylomicrobium oryzae]|jgi:16S rRNA (guanine527-N7)-methyltransferase|uniref:16S rRNA (guanine(527)-N(7))-methyltransferase RsmG n=1 Tax=Candidatus Methylomicrobium oryzae TaxID=2802053 RepID=UPI001923472C|nr:16S rRNA (guanine(527)-N(7))-methyltransferase RsmG [Methylomicrobium sp. RS1]MBL1262582.1 16S rRNA (guanine(527)-N(7))-methyltransferase RsmG [Methylomicrobium sp. RS1]